MLKQKIPSPAIPRLSLYYRALLECKASGFISSEEISRLTHFTAAQVRKDLAYFGQFGTPSKGYPIPELKKALLRILGTDREWKIALIGVGNLGSALLSYKGFIKQGFKIVVAFDNDPRKIGKSCAGTVIKDMSQLKEIVKKKNIKMAVLTVPFNVAEEVINKLVKIGIRAILNFAPIRPEASKGVEILNVDLSIELERLAYFLSRSNK